MFILIPSAGSLDAMSIFNRVLSDTEIWQRRCPTETEPLNCRGLLLRLPFERNFQDTTSSGWHPLVPPSLAMTSPYVRGQVGQFALSLGECV
jgi:hypothetical protein